MARFHELERAASDVIQNVKQIQELRHARLSVIGGLALWHYLPEYRSTDVRKLGVKIFNGLELIVLCRTSTS